jgi:hypothetical protein
MLAIGRHHLEAASADQPPLAPVAASEAEALNGGRPGIAVQLVLFAGVLATALLGSGLWRVFHSDELREFRFIAVALVTLFARAE